MREMIYTKTLAAAKKRAPWAAKIVKVYGGYIAFDCYQDYLTWHNQK